MFLLIWLILVGLSWAGANSGQTFPWPFDAVVILISIGFLWILGTVGPIVMIVQLMTWFTPDLLAQLISNLH